MSQIRSLIATLVSIASLALPVIAQPGAQPPPIPRQDIVIVIDNSGSMTRSDPLRLRGVAGSLILDAVETTSDLRAGLVVFNDRVMSDGQFHDADTIRQRLRHDQLQPPDGGTNMEEALARAIGMLGSSTADIKRILMITDGAPNAVGSILTNLVPHAAQAHIQIFALGFSGEVDERFLQQITDPTGGKTLVSPNQQKLLEKAKELVGNLDSLFYLYDQHLPSNQTMFEFDLPAGTDRARVTAILDQPAAFGQDDVKFELQGPPGAGDHTYMIRPDAGRDTVVAWTDFVSTPGHYVFKVMPRNGGHLGLHFYAEALSSMNVQLVVNPKASSYVAGDQIRVGIQGSTASGPIDPNAHVVAVIKTAAGGAQPVPFTNLEAIVQIPDVKGHQSLVVRVETQLAHAEAHYDYEVGGAPLAELQSTPPQLTLTNLVPKHAAEASFKLTPIFTGGKPHPLQVSFTLVSPIGTAELLTAGGSVLHAGGVAQFVVPPKGIDLTLRVSIDPNKSVPPAGMKFEENIEFQGSDLKPFALHFEGQYTKPVFELLDKLKELSLWWDPHRERVVRLGRVHTDLSEKSTFTITIPAAIYIAKGPKIADLALRVDSGELPDPEPVDNGRLRYGPIELPPGRGIPVRLVVTPDRNDGWEMQATNTPLDIQLVSSVGMIEAAQPHFRSFGAVHPPFIAARVLSGREIFSTSWLLIAGFLGVLIIWVNFQKVRRFWRYRPRTIHTLGLGPILLGDVQQGSGAAIALPSVFLPEDVRTMGHVSFDGDSLRIDSDVAQLVESPTLFPGNLITIPDDPDLAGEVWELEFIGSTGSEAEVEVSSSPSRWTPGRLVRWLLTGALCVFLGNAILATAWIAGLAYSIQ